MIPAADFLVFAIPLPKAGECGDNICPLVVDHVHWECRRCEAIDFSNPSCPDCRAMRPAFEAVRDAAWAAVQADAERRARQAVPA